MSVAAGSSRSQPPGAVATWGVAGALGAFTLAAMLSIGIFLLLPTICVFVFAAKRHGSAGAALGLPIGIACTVAVLTLLVASSGSPASGSGSSAVAAPR